MLICKKERALSCVGVCACLCVCVSVCVGACVCVCVCVCVRDTHPLTHLQRRRGHI